MSIDWWTLGIQTVNVVILIWLLRRFFWAPVAAMIEQRRAAAQHDLAEAATTRDRAAASLAEIERARAGIAKERDAVLAAARDEADRARADGLREAAKAVAAMRTAAQSVVESEKEAAEKAWADRAARLAIVIAGKLSARLDGSAVQAAFLDWLIAEIRKLPDAVKQDMATSGTPLEAVSAAPLAPADEERCRTLIAETLGAHPRIAFRADPSLIAGLELRGPHVMVSNSWRADLTKILADLEHVDGH